MHTLVILSAIVAAASAQWNGAPGWSGHSGGYGGGWAGPPANVVVQNGQVQDTPEVAAEKSKHFAQYNEAASRAASSPDTGAYNSGGYNGAYNGGYNGAYNGGNSGAYNGGYNGAEDNGQWNGDTGVPYNGGSSSGAYNGGSSGAYNGGNSGAYNGGYNGGYNNGGWAGEPAKIVVNNGQVQETPEVAAARAQHLAALQRAGSHGAPAQPHWG